MTHPALEALRIARDAELLASEAIAHGDRATEERESARLYAILENEVEVDIGRWVRRTWQSNWHRVPGGHAATIGTDGEWAPLGWRRDRNGRIRRPSNDGARGQNGEVRVYTWSDDG